MEFIRSVYRITSVVDFSPYVEFFQKYDQYITKLYRDLRKEEKIKLINLTYKLSLERRTQMRPLNTLLPVKRRIHLHRQLLRTCCTLWQRAINSTQSCKKKLQGCWGEEEYPKKLQKKFSSKPWVARENPLPYQNNCMKTVRTKMSFI